MKLHTLISFFILILLAVACNENGPEWNESNPPGENDVEMTEGPFYLNFNVYGSERATKASSYTYDDLENMVVNGKIYVFEESTDNKEENAVCITWGNLGPANTSDGTGVVVKTVEYRNIELKDFEYDASKTYYALAVLNYNDDFIPPYIGDTFEGWANRAQTSNMLILANTVDETKDKSPHYKYITMVNATGQANHTSGDFTPVTLVKIDKGDIKRGEFDSSHECKTTIFVQRNVAKVLVVNKNGTDLPSTDKMVPIGPYRVQMNISNWYLDVTNLSTYPVQKIGALTWEKTHFHTGIPQYDQICWAIDPNYSDLTKSKQNGDFSFSQLPWSNGIGQPMYCLENTFDIDNMLQGQTTRAVVRCQMEWWGNERGGGRNTEIRLPEGYINSDSKETNTGNNFSEGYFTIGKGDDMTLWDFKHIEEKLNNIGRTWDENFQVSLKESLKMPQPNPSTDGGGGYYTLQNLIDVSPVSAVSSQDRWNELAAALGLADADSDLIAYYFNCWTYYVVRIRHFSDSQGVKWNEDTKLRERDGEKVAKYEPFHLGRYGVLRNNEYTITINSVQGLGSPEPFPEITDDDTDDMPDEYKMNVSINIKNWNKRANGFVF